MPKSEKEILEDFILNTKSLDDLKSLLAQFNIFETLGIVSTEIRHSRVLSWLLNPNGNHGCGDYFIKLFLKHIFRINKQVGGAKVTIFDMDSYDLSNIEIRREWCNIDVLLISENNKFVVAVENKIYSGEHSNQLARYFDTVNKEYPGYEKLFVYLTPDGEEASTDKWVVFDYSTIADIVGDTISSKRNGLADNVKLFLQDYQTVLRRYVVTNPSEIEKICKGIYQKHKDALDLIFQYKPDLQYDMFEKIKELLKLYPDIIPDDSSKPYIRFTTKRLDEYLPKISKKWTGQVWTKSRRLVLFEIKNFSDWARLDFAIGPAPEESRLELFEYIKKNASVLNVLNSCDKKWVHIYHMNLLNKNDYEDSDIEKMIGTIKKKLDQFYATDLREIEKLLSTAPHSKS